MSSPETIQLAIQALEQQRQLLGDAAVDAAIASLQPQLKKTDEDVTEDQITAERKLVTVLFADISGFTALSEKTDPEEIRALMNRCFDHLVSVVLQYRGTVDKFIGDEIMVLFGAPKADEKHAELACRTALGMMEALKTFNEENNLNLGLHLGINTGLVVAGGIGSENRQQYSVMGDTVNLASRLCDAAGNNEIYTGPDLYNSVSSFFEFESLSAIALKGKREPVPVYALKEEKQQKEHTPDRAFHSSLIGRETELKTLKKAIAALREGKGTVVSVIGEAGMGKSRLVKECLSAANSLRWYEGRALSHLEQVSYMPVREVLKKMILTEDVNTVDDLKAALKQRLPGETDSGKTLLPFLLTLLALPLDDEEAVAVKYLTPAELRMQIQNAFIQFVQLSLQNYPLILIWEDLHWADEATLQLLERLLSLSHDTQLFNLLLFRPQKNAAVWQLHQKASETFYQCIELEPLSVSENNELVHHLFRTKAPVPELEKLVFEKAEGNPFYIEELIRTVVQQGLVTVKNGDVQRSGSLQDVRLPNTLQGVIAARIDQLPADAKTVLQTTSVLGRIFNTSILQKLLAVSGKKIDLQEALEKLAAYEMVRRREGKDESDEFIFKHAVTHEVAYDSLLIATRKDLHQRAAEIISEIYGKDQAFVTAYHYERAGKQKEALQFYSTAAELAESGYSYENALAFYGKAVAQAGYLLQHMKEPQWQEALTELHEKAGDVLRLQTQRDEALKAYDQATAFTKEEDYIRRARLLRKQSLCYEAIHTTHAGVVAELQEKAEQMLLKEGNREEDWWSEWVELKLHQCFSFYWTGQTEKLQRLIWESEEPITTYGTAVEKAKYQHFILWLHFRLSMYQLNNKDIDVAQRALALSLATGNLQMIADSKFDLGFTYLWANEMDLAVRYLDDCLLEAERIGYKIIASRTFTYLIIAYRRKGNVKKVETLLEAYLRSGQYTQIPEYVNYGFAHYMWMAWKEGDGAGVERHYSKLVDNWNLFTPFRFLFVLPMAAYCFGKGEWERCVPLLNELIMPQQRTLEPELATAVQKVQQDYEQGNTLTVQAGIKEILKLAEKYQYL